MHPTKTDAKILRAFIACGGLAALKADILAASKYAAKSSGHDEDVESIDVRLRYYEPLGFYVNTGLSDYDQDHRGFCGSSCAWLDMTDAEAETVAREMLKEILDQAAEEASWK